MTFPNFSLTKEGGGGKGRFYVPKSHLLQTPTPPPYPYSEAVAQLTTFRGRYVVIDSNAADQGLASAILQVTERVAGGTLSFAIFGFISFHIYKR